MEAMLIEDAKMYWNIANSGQGLLDTARIAFFHEDERVPGYTLFLAATISLFGSHFLPILLIQCLLDSITCLMIMMLGRHVFPTSFWLFGFLAAAWPNLIIHSGMILTDTLFIFFFTAFLLSFVWLLEKQNVSYVLMVGVMLGIATMTRPITQFIIFLTPIMVTIMLLCAKVRLRDALLQSIIICLVSLSFLSPILIKNIQNYGSFALTSQNGAHLQNWVAAEIVMLRDGISRTEAIAKMSAKTDQAIADLPLASQINPFIISAQHVKTATDEISTSPPYIILQSWAQGVMVNLAAPAIMIDKRVRSLPHLSFSGDTSGSLITRLQQFIAGSSKAYVTILLVSIGGAGIVSIIQFSGFFVQLRLTPILAILGFLTMAYFMIINGPVASPKYRLPTEPILIIWLGCGLYASCNLIKKWFYNLAAR
ncbi:glycosyltransferase family 39 protein [Alphaproteobacteria bacterium]|nr:glycosyltransferase family 39 protein [Alphaproteobacteria bacterium]